MTQTDMTPLQRLAKVLQLGTPSNYRNHTYINGESLYFPTGRVYGGQVIAQSLMAASRTVAPSRLPNSIHGYFISAGDIRQDLLFDVENLRDGRSFSARRVNVTQAQGSILTAIASFQEHDQEGIEFADPMPENIPDPDSLTSAKQLMEPYAEQSPFAKYYAEKSPFDIRHVTRTIMLGADKKSASEDSGKQMVDEGRRQGGRAAGHASCDAGDGLRPDHAGADSAPCWLKHRHAGHFVCVHRPFDVVVPRHRHQPVASVRARHADRGARTRLGPSEGLHTGWRAGGLHGAGSDVPRAEEGLRRS